MDPVYAGTIAGMALLFGGFVCGLGIFIYKECQLRETAQYTRV
jgi:hypothetical protein